MTRLSLKSLLIIIVVLLIGIVGLWQIQRKAQPVKADWFNESWMYRKSIGISNASGTNQSNFRVNLSIGTSSLIAAGKMKSDCTDVRLTDIQGKLLPHWVQTGTCNTDATVIWTKIPFLSTSANLIYFYYGNPSADDITDSSVLPDSCSTVNAYLGSGLHYVDPDGKTGQNPFQAYCDMTTDGGGWSLVASWGTAPEWTKTSTSTAAVVGGTTPVNTVSANFGNVVINDFRILASDTATTVASNAYADWYYHYDTATTWKEVWAPTPNKGGDLVHTYRSTTPRQALKPFNYAYNLRFSYQVTQTYNNLSDWGISDQYAGCLPDYWAALTSPGNPFGVYSLSYYSGANGANCSGSVGDGSLGICPSNQSGCITGQDRSTNNAKIGYDDRNACAGFASVGTTNVGELPGVQANTKLWWFIRRTAPASVAYSVASAGSEEASPAPIAYWKFDEGVGTSAYDSSSNKNHGYFINTPVWKNEAECVIGKCLEFTNSSSWVRIADKSVLKPTYITLEGWFYRYKDGNVAGMGIFLSKGGNYLNATNTTAGVSFMLNSGQKTLYTNNNSTSNNKWYHLAATYDGSDIKLYLDGKYLKSYHDTSGLTGPNDDLSIGIYGNWSYSFNGKIDEVKIYAYARTPAQIKQDYQAGRAKVASNKGGSTVGGSSKSLSDGLVGYWKMDEGVGTSIADYSGNNNIGTFGTGSSAPGWTTGKFGIGTSFDGVNDYIDIPNTILGSQNTTGLTYSAWVYINSISGNNAIIGGAENTSYNYYASGGIWLNAGIPRMTAYDGSAYKDATADAAISIGSWHHIVGTYSPTLSKIYIYVDGVKKNETTCTSITTNMTESYIGQNVKIIDRMPFNGKIDEIRIYNRALTAEEVKDLYEYAPGPVAYYNFEEGVGTTVYDRSGNNNNGIWQGTLGSQWGTGKYGKAGNCNGTDNYISTTNFMNGFNNFSISAWVKTTQNTSHAYWYNNPAILGIKQGSGDSNDYLWVNVSGKFGSYDELLSGGNNYDSNKVIADGKWHFLSVSKTGTTMSYYIDGVSVGSKVTGTDNVRNDTFEICRAYWPDSMLYSGLIDEVKIYNYAISPKQIIADMNAGHPAVGSPVGSAIGYWKFDEGYGASTANCGSIGTILNGTLMTGTSIPTWSNNGKFNKALNFLGNDSSYISIFDSGSNNPLDLTSQFTLSSWFYINSISSYSSLFYKYGTYFLGVFPNGSFRLYANNGSWDQKYASPAGLINTGKWYHIILTYDSQDSKSIKGYVNGKFISSIGVTAPLIPNDNALYIGRGYTGENGSMNGLIDEVKIYNYALTEDEVKLDYNHGASSNIGVLSKNTGNTAPNTAQSQAYCIPGDTSTCNPPIAEWNMDEKTGSVVYDTSGNGFTGAITGATWTQGKVGQALKFSGSSQYIDFNPDILDTGCSGTISLWIKRGPWNESYNTILTKSNGGSWVNNHVQISRDSTTDNIIFEIADNSNSTSNQVTTGTINENTWYHLTMSWNGTTLIGYVNGQEVDRYSTSICPASDSTRFSLGRGAVGTNRYFNGIIDQVKIYNYARTPAQIAWDYNRGVPIGWWKFDECQGNIAHDASGVGNTGTIVIGAGGSQVQLGTCSAGDTSAWSNGKTGKLNSAMSFDGTDDYVDCGNNPSLDITDAITVEAWIYPLEKSTYYRTIISKGYGETENYQLRMERTSSGNRIMFEIGDGSVVIRSPQISINNEQWYHIVGYFDGLQVGLFINGKKQASKTYSGKANTNTNNVTIGKNTTGEFWRGLIDDVRIYNYALTGEQIKQIYNDGAVKFN